MFNCQPLLVPFVHHTGESGWGAIFTRHNRGNLAPFSAVVLFESAHVHSIIGGFCDIRVIAEMCGRPFQTGSRASLSTLHRIGAEPHPS